MKTKEEKFFSLSASSKNSLVNVAKRRGWKYEVKPKGKVFDVILHVPEDFPDIPTP
jgi:hypothetical protein